MTSLAPEQILAARKAANLTQQEAADLMQLSKDYWCSCEKGRRNMSPHAFDLFLIKTGQHPDYKPA